MDIRKHIEEAAKTSGDKVSLVFGDRRFTYAELLERVTGLSMALTERGLKKGGKVATYLSNVPEFVDIYLAVLSMGAILVPLDFRLKPEEVDEILDDSRPEFLFTSRDMAKGLNPKEYLKDIFIIDGVSLVMGTRYDSLISYSEGDFPEATFNDEDEALHLYTSGSTGRPKGVILCFRHLDIFPAAMMDFFPVIMNEDTPFGVILPMSHISGPILINLLLKIKSRLVIFEGWRPDVVWKTVEREGVAWFHGVPPIFQMLLTDPNLERYDLSSLEFVAMMGMSVPKTLMEEFSRRLKGLAVIQGYGLTETSPIISFVPLKDAKLKRGSVGKPVNGAEVRVVSENGEDLPTGESGEIIVRGPMLMKGYFKQPEETASVIRDGWFHTGDLGAFDEDGFLYHMGRSKELVITGGLNVYPAEVENALLKHQDVMESAVIGVPDEKRGEVLKAFVVRRDGSFVAEKELQKFLRGHLADFKVPREAVFVKQIPLLGIGKVDKVALRENRFEAV